LNIRKPLAGIRVHLSGAVPKEGSARISEFVNALAARIFSEGGCVIHGSHPTLVDPLINAAKQYIAAGGGSDVLTLVRTKRYSETSPQQAEIDAQRRSAQVHIVQALPTGEPAEKDSRQLTPMRDWMADRSDAIVCVGGKGWEVNRSLAGVPEELETMLQLGKPGFVVAAFGGAIAGFIQDDPGILGKLRNGLSFERNQELSKETSIDTLVDAIVTQLRNLPLVRESVSKGRNFRILALDGGGLRGAFTASVLAKWDDMLGSGGGNRLVDHFDLVAGTSTGAILAIGLALGLKPKEILDFYKTKGPHIFPKDRSFRHWLSSKHESSTLREKLQEVYKDKKLSDASCRLVIPTVGAKRGRAQAIVTPHQADRTAFRDLSAVNAALASSAAPTYFDSSVWEGPIAVEEFLDGGVWANNPILPAVAEAVRHLKIPLDRIDVLSVGTLTSERDFTESLSKGKVGWAMQSVDLFFSAQEHGALLLADGLLGPTRHYRVNQTTPVEIKLDDTEAIKDMIDRGNEEAKSSFQEVRSRYLDQNFADPWERH